MIDCTNQNVRHTVFGTGRVVQHQGNTLCVEFEGCGEKKFVYPDAFDGFLTMCTEDLATAVNLDLETRNEQIAAERLARRQHEQELMAIREEEKAATKRKSRSNATTSRKKAVSAK